MQSSRARLVTLPKTNTAMNLPPLLADLTIIDITRHLPGPFASQMLCDLGAHIIKLEPPEGDPSRTIGHLFQAVNRNKELRTLDLKQAAGRGELRKLLTTADVFLEGFRPGVMHAMGLDFKALQQLNPRLVMCSITGYGQSGVMSDKAGHDLNFMAMAGILDQQRSLQGQPIMANIQWGDLAGGSAMAVIGILAGVIHAQKTGQACYVDVSMAHGLWAQQLVPPATGALTSALLGRMPGAGEDLLNGGLPCYNLYTTQDQRTLAVAALELKFWRLFSHTVGKPEWTNLHWSQGLVMNSAASNTLKEQVAALIQQKPLAEWQALFAEVDACVTPVLSLAEAQEHALFQAERRPWEINTVPLH